MQIIQLNVGRSKPKSIDKSCESKELLQGVAMKTVFRRKKW